MTDANKLQTFTLAGEEYVVVRRAEYDALRGAVREEVADATLLSQILEDPNEEWVPADVVKRLAAGESPIRVWRTYRGMKATELAVSASVAASYLSDIENRKKPGSIGALKRIAVALDVALDELVE